MTARQILKIKRTLEDKKLTVELDGIINISSIDDLEERITPEVLRNVKELVLDFNYVEAIFSCGLRLLLKMQKSLYLDCVFRIINVNEEVMKIFEMTGFADVFTIEKKETLPE